MNIPFQTSEPDKSAFWAGKQEMLKEFGELLRKERTEQGMTIRALGDAADIHCSYITKIEKGEFHPATKLVERFIYVLDLNEIEAFGKARRLPKRVLRSIFDNHTILVPFLFALADGEPDEKKRLLDGLEALVKKETT